MDARSINRFIDPNARRTRLMATRSVVGLVDNGGTRQKVQIHRYGGMDGDTDIERFQNYGLASWPKPGAESIDIALGGNGAHRVTILIDDRRYYFRVSKEGEVALYDDQGQVVWLRRDGIHIKSPFTVRLEGDIIELVAHTALRQDVAGYASELKFTGGTTWTNTTWQTGATLVPVPNPIAPPLKFPEIAE